MNISEIIYLQQCPPVLVHFFQCLLSKPDGRASRIMDSNVRGGYDSFPWIKFTSTMLFLSSLSHCSCEPGASL